MCSSLTERGCDIALRALEYGAVDIILKPAGDIREFLAESKKRICDVVRAASRAKLGPPRKARREIAEKLTADAILAYTPIATSRTATHKIVAIGASTGGTEALQFFLESMPADAPAMVIVQHMPEGFTDAFAKRLNNICRVEVAEACHRDPILPGRALVAPGNRHLMIKRGSDQYYVELRDGPPVCRHRPSVDVLFRSAALYAGANAVGVIMTGMGDDGARGLVEMRQAGAYTIAQDEASCVVFGMPREAIQRGAAQSVVPLGRIPEQVLRVCSGNRIAQL